MHLLRRQLGLALAAATILVAAATPVGAEAPWTGRVVRWIDGDTLWVTRSEARGARGEGRGEELDPRASQLVKIRLHWADAPEVAQHGVGQAGGVAALELASQLWPPGTPLRIAPRSTSYGRIVADCDRDGVDVARILTYYGFAWNDPRYKPPPSLVRAEQAARAAKRGVWDEAKYGKPVAPWEWRKQKRRELRGASDAE